MSIVRIDALPPELYEAIEAGNPGPLDLLRERLQGNEVVAVKDTLPLFERMMVHMSKANPSELAEIETARQRVISSTEDRPLSELIDVVEDGLRDAFDQQLKKLSPAAYMMRQMLRREHASRQDAIQTYNLPAEVIPAIETRRVELLSLARNRIREGRLFSHTEARAVVQMCVDYTNTRFDHETISERFPGGTVPLPNFSGSVPMCAATCEEVIKLLETVIGDLDYNERQHAGVLVPDGQGRGRSVLRSIA